MLRMRVGDPIELLVDARRLNSGSAIVATLNRTAAMTFAEAVQEVRSIPGVNINENLARAIVASARGNIMGVLRYFRVGAINYDWGEEGVSIKADLQNYWTPSYDVHARLNVQNARGQHHADRANAQAAQTPVDMDFTTAEAQGQPEPTVRAQPSEALRQRARQVGRVLEQERAAQTRAAARVDGLFEHGPAGSRWRDI
jgi:hypothetical protein